jgi:hypothetical protein
VNMSFLMRKMLAILVIVGLGVSPLYAAAMKGLEYSAQASTAAEMMDGMPCHPDKPSSGKSSTDKACPCMAACLALSFQGMPPAAGAIVVPVTTALRTTFQSVRQLASLTPSPPARPPRA